MKTSVLLLLFVPILASAQGKLSINGKLKGLKDGSVISMTDVNRPVDTLASAIVKKGGFLLKTELKEPMLVNINFGNGQTLMSFFSGATVKMTGDVAKLKQIKINGSSTSKDFKDFQKTFDPLFENLVKINQRGQTAQPNEVDSLRMAMDKAKDTIQQSIDVFIRKRKSSPVSAFLLAATYQLNDDVLLAEARVNALKQDALTNTYGIFLKETIAEAKITAVGSVAMDFTQADTSGAPISLSSFRGKYVLLDFWASWCGPCRQENPNVVSNFQKFSTRNFTVLGVSLDRPGQKDRWLQAIHADNLTWTHVSDLQFWNNSVAQQYRVQSIPQNLLIGPDGKIVAKNLRGPALEAKLCEVLGCN